MVVSHLKKLRLLLKLQSSMKLKFKRKMMMKLKIETVIVIMMKISFQMKKMVHNQIIKFGMMKKIALVQHQ